MRAPLYADSHDELFGAAAIEHPQRLYARLRREHPISRVADTGVHLVATWDLVDEVLHREDDFSANLTGVLLHEHGRPGRFELPDTGATQVIATADEPRHGVHRRLVRPGLGAARIAALEGPIRAWTRQALCDWIADGGGDFVPIAERIPAQVVAHLLGLPEGDVRLHRDWAMMGGDILAGAVDEATLTKLARETGRMFDYLDRHLEAAAAAPFDEAKSPLLARLAQGVGRGEIARTEAIGIAIIMFGAGGESTAALLGSVVRRLAEDEAMAATLRADPGLIPRFVEEVARLETPFKFHYRSVRRDCELGGAELGPGDRLMLLWASANRDAAQFEDPDTLRLDRPHPKHHMSFGRGNHFCVGAPLARLEARVVLEELLDGTIGTTLAVRDGRRYAHSIFVRRLERLPLVLVG